MEISQEARLIILMLAAFLVGICVLLLKPNYRIEEISRSNARYYAETVAGETPGPDASDDLTAHTEVTSEIEF